MRIRLKRHKYTIATYDAPGKVEITIGFTLSCQPVPQAQALKIARTLLPGVRHLRVSLKSHY